MTYNQKYFTQLKQLSIVKSEKEQVTWNGEENY